MGGAALELKLHGLEAAQVEQRLAEAAGDGERPGQRRVQLDLGTVSQMAQQACEREAWVLDRSSAGGSSNLHDATQQRLTSVTVVLGLAESRLGSPGRAEEPRPREAGLAIALAELRDLSQGIHRSVLAEGGLGPALEDPAYTTPLPVRIASDLNGRFPTSRWTRAPTTSSRRRSPTSPSTCHHGVGVRGATMRGSRAPRETRTAKVPGASLY
jgi:hypothetical protein